MLSTTLRTTLVYHGAKMPLTGGVIIQDIRLANLKLLIHEAGDNASELSRRLDNVPPSYISQIITGVPTPKGTRRGVGDALARKLEKGMNKPRGWMDQPHPELSAREMPPGYSNVSADIPIEAYELPVVSWVSAGRTEAIVDPYPTGRGKSTVLVHKKFGPGAYALEVRGDSMFDPARPLETFPPGVFIIVNPDARAENGSLVIARFDDQEEATFKKLVMDAGKVYLHPLNPRYPIIEVNGGMSIGGVVQATVFYRAV